MQSPPPPLLADPLPVFSSGAGEPVLPGGVSAGVRVPDRRAPNHHPGRGARGARHPGHRRPRLPPLRRLGKEAAIRATLLR